MKKITEHFYCDLCGKKLIIERGDFINLKPAMDLPHNLIHTVDGGIDFSHNYHVGDICMECAYKVTRLVDELKDSESPTKGE